MKGKELGSGGRHFKSQNWACFILLNIKPEEGLPVEDSLCCFTCEYTTSRVQAHRQLEPPLCGGAHGACGAALTELTLLSHRTWARSVFGKAGTQTRGILHAHRYSPYKGMHSWVCTCTCGMSACADSCTTTYMCSGCTNASERACAHSGHVFAWAGQGSLLPRSLFFVEWEKAVSSFLLSAAGRHFSAVSCNLFQLCVLITACSWWDSS